MIVSDFLQDSENLINYEVQNPIQEFTAFALEQADNSLEFDQGNIQEMLDKASEYEHTVVVVEDHTIVHLASLDDCTKSSSWGACMPKAEGFIKKGDLEKQEDYLNNIIGRPDKQKRIAFYFN